ncbi:MAG: hypothetical protein PVTTEEND_000644 [Candidatus Fervidibacter sp.]|jgi:hypothetical protein
MDAGRHVDRLFGGDGLHFVVVTLVGVPSPDSVCVPLCQRDFERLHRPSRRAPRFDAARFVRDWQTGVRETIQFEIGVHTVFFWQSQQARYRFLVGSENAPLRIILPVREQAIKP